MSPEARQYLQTLSAAEKRALCGLCGISIHHFYNILSTNSRKRFSIPLACKLEVITKKKLTRRQLRPDLDWDLLGAPQ